MKEIESEGVSLRTVHTCLIVLAVIVSAVLILATFHSSNTFLQLSHATDEYIELQKAAYALMDASDNLTEKVQRFTLAGKTEYMYDYFREAFETRRREEAVEVLSQDPQCRTAYEKLALALHESVDLMNREYYAMKLVVEAKSYRDYPDKLRSITLTEEDTALSPNDKMELAQSMVLDETYYSRGAGEDHA